MKNCTACPWSWMQDHKECYYESTPLGNQRLARQRGRPNWQRRTREPNWDATQQTMEFIDQPSDIAQSVIPHSGTRQQHSTEEATYFDWHRVVWLRWDYQTPSASDQCILSRWCQYGKITHLLKAWSMVEDLEVSAQSSPALASIPVPISSICSSEASSRVCSSSQCHVCSKDRFCFFSKFSLGTSDSIAEIGCFPEWLLGFLLRIHISKGSLGSIRAPTALHLAQQRHLSCRSHTSDEIPPPRNRLCH